MKTITKKEAQRTAAALIPLLDQDKISYEDFCCYCKIIDSKLNGVKNG